MTNRRIDQRIAERARKRQLLAQKTKVSNGSALEGGSLRGSFSAQDLKSSVALTELEQTDRPNQNSTSGKKAEDTVPEKMEKHEKQEQPAPLNELRDRKMQSLRRLNSMTSLERPDSHKAARRGDPRLSDLPPLKDVPKKLVITPTAAPTAGRAAQVPPLFASTPTLNQKDPGPYYVSQFSKQSFSFLQPAQAVPVREDAYQVSYATMKRKDSLRSTKSLQ